MHFFDSVSVRIPAALDAHARMLAGYRPPCRGVVCGRRGAPRSGMAWQDASDSGASVCPLVSIARARSAQRDRVFGLLQACVVMTLTLALLTLHNVTHARVSVGSCALISDP